MIIGTWVMMTVVTKVSLRSVSTDARGCSGSSGVDFVISWSGAGSGVDCELLEQSGLWSALSRSRHWRALPRSGLLGALGKL